MIKCSMGHGSVLTNDFMLMNGGVSGGCGKASCGTPLLMACQFPR